MSGDREIPAEDSIKVVCRFRPLNDSEEKAGSKFIVKFPSGPDDNCISIAVSCFPSISQRFTCLLFRRRHDLPVIYSVIGFRSVRITHALSLCCMSSLIKNGGAEVFKNVLFLAVFFSFGGIAC